MRPQLAVEKQEMFVEDLVGSADRAVARCHVTGTAKGAPVAFEVASFITARDGLVGELTEVWADVGATGQRGRARTDEEGHGG